MKLFDLFIILCLLFVIQYSLLHTQENLEAVIQTNSFSDLRCIDDSQPIVRFVNAETVQCLSKDGSNCLLRKDFGISDNVKCNDINTHLVKEIRNINSGPRKVFDDLEQNTNYNLLTCTPDGMNNPNHWCGSMFNTILNKKCIDANGKPTPESRFGYLKNPCSKIPIFSKYAPVGTNFNITTRSEILEAKQKQKQSVSKARSKK
jgi:hypothetical protein